MLARKKKSLRLNASQSSESVAPCSSYASLTANANNSSKKSLLSLSSLNSSPAGFPVSIKGHREERDSSSRRASGYGGSGVSNGRSGPQQVQAVNNNSVLGEMIPRMKTALFSADCNNVQKTRELRRLLSCMNEWGAINDQTMIKLIDGLKENIEGLDDKMSALVHQVLDADWCSRSGKVLKAFEDFLSELLVIRPFYTGSVIQSLIKKFIPRTFGNDTAPDEITLSERKVFEVVQRNLKKVLDAFPRMKDSVIKTMGAAYPYMGKSPYIHYCYVKNLLDTLNYAPHLRSQILQLIIHKLCRIDVNVPREDVESLSEIITEEISSPKVKTEDGKEINIDLDREQMINSIITNSPTEINPLVNILDLCLTLVFEYLESFVSKSTAEVVELDSFFDSMFSTFEGEVLPSYGVNHVQFVYFYLVSEQPSYVQKLLEYLWKRVLNVNTAAVYRVQCMAYIAGILSRANYVSVKILKRWLTRMSEWASLYVDQRVKSAHWSSVNIQAHGSFYAVCQCIFYVFAFRNKDLIGSRKCTSFTGTLNLGRLVTCDLNPLKAVVEPVAVAFVNAAHTHQISYCRTVLERNQRATIPTSVRESLMVSDMDTIGAVSSTLETFFPFDPYLLPRSRKWIDSSYRTYEPYLSEVKIEKQDSPHHWSNSHNEDSIDMELSNSFRDKDGSHFIAAGFMESSDIRDDGDGNDFMDHF